MQRFKATEMALLDGKWASAKHLELVADNIGLATSEEKLSALRDQGLEDRRKRGARSWTP